MESKWTDNAFSTYEIRKTRASYSNISTNICHYYCYDNAEYR